MSIKVSYQQGSFNVNWFLEQFCNVPYMQVTDIIDLIVFLQQTAFDRQFGVERDKLKAKPWLELHAQEFRQLATSLGIVTPLPPKQQAYCGTGIMGAASFRVGTRIQYFNSLLVPVGDVWALSGNRELSKGLDEEVLMQELALAVNKDKPATFIEKGEGAAKRVFLDGITETMMVNYLLQKMCAGKQIALVDSKIEEGHWRATTSQGAKDIATIVVQKILEGSLSKAVNDTYHFMIIAEQPYAGRMARQVQRAFNAEIQKKKIESSIKIVIEGVGPGITEKELADVGVLTRMNSELGSLMAERFNDARLQMQKDVNKILRDPKLLLFMDRDATYNKLKEQNSQSPSVIAQNHALQDNHAQVEEYQTQHKADVNFIALGYAMAGNHAKVEVYRTKYNVDVHLIAHGYARACNHEKVEEYRSKHHADVNIIAQGYVLTDKAPSFYRAINRLEQYGVIGETIKQTMLRLHQGRKNYWNPYWINSGTKLAAISAAIEKIEEKTSLLELVKNPGSIFTMH